MSQHHSTNRIEVTKVNPCVHCGKPDYCYRLGDDLSACKRGIEPATGWVKTGKLDKDGTALYGTVASQEQWLKDGKKAFLKERKATLKGDVVKETKYRYPIFKPSEKPGRSDLYSHLGKIQPTANYAEVIRTDYEKGDKDIYQRSYVDGKSLKTVDSSLRDNVALYTEQGFWIELLNFQFLTNEELSNETIFIVEGEKCVDTMSEIGATAFCSYGGSKWRESDTQWLLSLIKYRIEAINVDGKKEYKYSERENWQEHCPTIVLCPDIDEPGLKHIINVHKELIKANVSPDNIKVFLPYPVDKLSDVPLSKGRDVADMLEDNPNLTVEDFLSNLKTTKECHFLEANLISLEDYIWGDVEDNSSPPTTDELPSLFFLYNETTVEIDWLIQDLLPSKSAVVLTGSPGVGKSVSLIDLAAAVADGSDWLGKECKQGKVLILNNDQSLDILLRYAKKRVKEDDVAVQNEISILDGWKADDDSLKQLSKWVEKYQFSLVIMDSVRQCICHPLNIDQNAPDTGYKLKEVSDLVTKAGGCFIAIHHETKSNDAKGVNKSAGSTSIISNADAHWRLSKGSDSDKVYLKMPKTRGYKAVEMAYEIDFENGVCLPVKKSTDESGSDATKEQTVKDRILHYLADGEGVSKEKLLQILQVKLPALNSALKRLMDSKQVVAVDDPQNPKGKLYKLSESE